MGRNKRLKTRTDSLSTAAISRISVNRCETASRVQGAMTSCSYPRRLISHKRREGGWFVSYVDADAFGHIYFLITKAKRTVSPTTTTATATKDGFNVNYAMLPLTLTLPQGSRQRDTRWQFAFTYCPPFPMRCPCPTLALAPALTTKFACHVAKFRRAKKVKSAAWKVGKR